VKRQNGVLHDTENKRKNPPFYQARRIVMAVKNRSKKKRGSRTKLKKTSVLKTGLLGKGGTKGSGRTVEPHWTKIEERLGEAQTEGLARVRETSRSPFS